jgi:hypothetical protein
MNAKSTYASALIAASTFPIKKNVYLMIETRNPGSDYRQPPLGINSESIYASFGIAASTSSMESHL